MMSRDSNLAELRDILRRVENLLGLLIEAVTAETAALGTTGRSTNELDESMTRLTELVDELDSFIHRPLTDNVAIPRFQEIRRLHTEGTERWRQIGALLSKISLETSAPGDNSGLHWPEVDVSSPLIRDLSRDWGTREDALIVYLEAQNLAEQDRLLFHSRYIQNLTQMEIASLTGVSQSATASRLTRLTNRLALRMGINKLADMAFSEGYERVNLSETQGDRLSDRSDEDRANLNPLTRNPGRNEVVCVINLGLESPVSIRSLVLPTAAGEEINRNMVDNWNRAVQRFYLENRAQGWWHNTSFKAVSVYRRKAAEIFLYTTEHFLMDVIPSLSEGESVSIEAGAARNFSHLRERLTNTTREDSDRLRGMQMFRELNRGRGRPRSPR